MKKICFLTSLIFSFSALISEIISKAFFSFSVHLVAKSTIANVQDVNDLKFQSMLSHNKGTIVAYLGLAFAAAGIFLWIASCYWKDKKLVNWLPLLLVIIYLMISTLLIV